MKTLLAALLATSAGAIPRFAVRTGFDCGSCHVNPTGGGIRTAFARNVFARQWLALPAGAEAMDEAFSPDIGRHIAIGTDVRPGYLWQNSPDPAFSDTSSLVTMPCQGGIAVPGTPPRMSAASASRGKDCRFSRNSGLPSPPLSVSP